MANKKEKTFTLNKEFTDKWLKDLRSNKYVQGPGFLLNQEWDDDTDSWVDDSTKTHCCLGVGLLTAGACESEIKGQELPNVINNTIINDGFPKELYHEHFTEKVVPGQKEKAVYEKVSLISILTSLNDGLSYDYYQKIIKTFPNVRFSHIPEEGKKHSAEYTFSEIASWIEDNVNLVEDDSQ